jgi:hypothetical protein
MINGLKYSKQQSIPIPLNNIANQESVLNSGLALCPPILTTKLTEGQINHKY